MKKFHKFRWRLNKTARKKVLGLMGVAVALFVLYSLVLPALTLDSQTANQTSGVHVESQTSASTSASDSSNIPTSTNLAPEDNSLAQTDTEKGETKEEEKLLTAPTTLKAEENGLLVTAQVTAEDKLPEGVSLKVKEIKEDTEDYQQSVKKAQEKLSLKNAPSVHVYDISFIKDNQELEPESKVSVTITPKDALETSKDDLKVLHVKDDGEVELVNSENTGDEHKTTEVKFESDSFSNFLLVDPSEPKTDSTPVTGEDRDASGNEENQDNNSSSNDNPEANTFKVRFISDDKEVTQTAVIANTRIEMLPENPFKAGYRFDHWEDVRTHDTVTADTIVTEDMTVQAVYTKVSIYTVTVNYYYYNNSSKKDVTFYTHIFQLEDRDTPYQITPPASTKVLKREDSTLASDATYYPKNPLIDIKKGDLESKDAADGKIDGNVTMTLQYVPYSAEYTVHYMLKDLTGNGYSEIQKVTARGVIDSTVSPQILSYDYATFEKTKAVELTKAKGQDLYVYYTRNRFNLYYDTRGARDYIAPDSALYGSPLSITQTKPVRRGYTFVGWHEKEDLSDPAKTIGMIVLDKNKTLYAEWKADDVDYRINYYKEVYDNGTNTTHYVYDSTVVKKAKTGTTLHAKDAPDLASVPDGYERESAPNGPNATSSVTVDAKGTSILKVYYSLVHYTIRFDLDHSDALSGYGKGQGEMTVGDKTYTYTEAPYQITDVVLGQNIHANWPKVNNIRYIIVGSDKTQKAFAGWDPNGLVANPTNDKKPVDERAKLKIKSREVTTDIIKYADSNHVVTYKAYWQPQLVSKTTERYLQSADNPNLYEKSDEYSGVYNSRAGSKIYGGAVNGFILRSDVPAGYPPAEEKDSNGVTTTYRFYYTRNNYSIDYYIGSRKLKTLSNIPFDANINTETYNAMPERPKSGATTDYSDYTWGGWYTDAEFNTPYTFDKMPSHNLVLYARWVPPTFKVTFDLNGGEGQAPPTQEVSKYQTAEEVDNPTRSSYIFDGWYTAPEGGDLYDWDMPITQDTTLYAHWRLKPLTYKVRYLDADNDNPLAAEKVVTSPAFSYHQEIEEKPLAITGYLPKDSHQTVTLDYDTNQNVITFYYTKKAAKIKYTVRYLLKDDPTKQVAPPVERTVDGNTIVAKESAAAVDKSYLAGQLGQSADNMEDYYPLTDAESIVLTSNQTNNDIIFYYVAYDTAHLTINYLDMDGKPLQGVSPDTVMLRKPSQYHVDHKAITGYTYAKSEDSKGDKNKEIYKIAKGDKITINLYYQKNITLTAATKNKDYDAKPLTLHNNDLNDLATGYEQSLETGDRLTAISYSGSQTDAGSSKVLPSEAKIVDATGKSRNYYYAIKYGAGALTVNKRHFTMIVTGDRLETTYDGTEKVISGRMTTVGDDDLYKKTDMTYSGPRYVREKDAGTYPLNLTGKFENINNNFDVVWQCHDGELVIKRRPVSLTSASAERGFDGTALTARTVTASTPTATTGFVLDEGVTYNVTGSQTRAGSTPNSFTYAPKLNTKLTNYDISTTTGRLRVTPRVNLQKTKADWTALAGGKFQISRLENGVWTAVDGMSDLTITSTNGITLPDGLKAGRYRLTETQAPDGYVILDKSIYLTVVEHPDVNNRTYFTSHFTDESGTSTQPREARFVRGSGNYNDRIQIVNIPGRALPHTGGIGTTLYIVIGGALVALSTVLQLYYWYHKHRERSDDTSQTF
ncbi:InlB B-repeat-containing protein [Streptococcus sciuri]|uniref:InlB B-repeat-containing protein n=1 Tax=Streptococcus sciuri TaxID=2973939 RepID=A0ABT2F932_9STRE|nr:InlB B-repeat-containing protein [Streptococcus sciuri]MCS4488887.1 InlB B-repeat-containing protein [Streptococcus sciuri]